MRQIVSLVIFLFASYFLSAQESIPLEGKIDKYPIVMEIQIYDSACTIKYFYTNQLKDILLEGTVDNKGKIKVTTEDPEENKINKEQFELTKTSSGYTGSWISGKKRLPVNLKEANLEKFKNQYEHLPKIKELKKADAYSFIKIASFDFVLDSTSINGNVQISWYHEKYSGFILPRIKNGYSNPILEKINSILLEKHLQESMFSLDCLSAQNGEYESNTEYIFSTKYLLSINVNTSYYCGGAHPDFGSEGLNFDTQTGELLKLDNIFWFTNTNPPEENSGDWYDYRDTFSAKVVEIFKNLYPEQMKSTGDDSDDYCDYTDESVWDFPNWYFTDKGLYLGAVFARVARSCDSPEWSVIPYKQLKKYLNPRSKLKLPD
ncbi:MAG TPA: hypothetical protein VIS75_04800 [Chitinophagaceae bacterium]